MKLHQDIYNRPDNMEKIIILMIVFTADIAFTRELADNQIENTQMLKNTFDKDASYVTDDLTEMVSKSTWKEKVLKRRRRAVQYCRITFINKSGLEVNVFYMNRYGYRQRYFLLRRNERMVVRSKVGTTWLAYDIHNTQTLLLNRKYNFLIYHKHLNKDIDVVITTRSLKKVEPPADYIGEKFVEVMVIADWSVVKKHGKRTEKYILTLMNAVNRLFQDKSFGTSLSIVVTRIKLLKSEAESRANLKLATNAPMNSMRNACNYAATLNYPSDNHQDHFDFAVILTRKRFGYSGYTPIFRMCDLNLGCTIVLERGFQNAHVIAHEIGHSLGIDHDGENNDCHDDGPKGSLMGPTLWSRFDHFYWSECTRRQIKETVSYFVCLNDRPQRNITKFTSKLPGVHFTMDEQCKFYLGSHYKACKGFNFRNGCRYLYCTPHWLKSRKNCIPHYLPPLDGTPCKYGKDWCVKGQCFPYGRFNYAPINGGWSDWGSWNDCSSKCGIGLRYRNRQCDNPSPKYEGKDCKGHKQEKKICNLKRCKVLETVQEKRDRFCNTLRKGNWHWYTEDEMHTSVRSTIGLNCSFEKENCSWTQETDDNFDWARQKGNTPSMDTGPSYDNTFYNDSGHYMYIEASDEATVRRLEGHTARLKSPTINAPEICFRFFYHLLGSHIGALKVYKLVGGKRDLLWHRTKNRGDQWLPASLYITSNQAYNIIIEGVRGIHYQGDIAVDDITVVAGKCDKSQQNGINDCSITCANVQGKKYLPGSILPDAYKCYTDDRDDICINGLCEKLGCDMKFGSNMTNDNCQICGGDNRNCTLIEGNTAISSRDIVEDTLMLFPPGSTNIYVAIKASSNASVGLRHSQTDEVAFYENAKSAAKLKHIAILGCAYSIEQSHKGDAMTVRSKGPTNGIIHLVMAGVRQSHIKIQYRFYKSNFRYEWMIKKRTNCSVGCQDPDLVCVQLPNGVESNNFNCPKKSSQPAKCILGNCVQRYAWQTSKWSSCSRTCGLAAKIRKVTCNEIGKDAGKIVHEQNCADKKPSPVVYCRGPPCKLRVKKCREKSPLCPRLKKRGVCGYSNVKKMCCKTCA